MLKTKSMFVLYPVTILDESDKQIKSVWATKKDFFDFFLLQDTMMASVPADAQFSLSQRSQKKPKDLFLIKRDANWSKLYGTLYGYVESDDEFFLDELKAGFARFDFDIKLEKAGATDRETFRQPLQLILYPILR